MGNIVINIPDGKKVVCFISKKENKRYYNFLNLTGTDILACTEWDIGWEYLGMCEPEREKAHTEYSRRIAEMKLEYTFTTEIGMNNEEKLIDFNDKGISEEGNKKYQVFKRNIMDLLNIGYSLDKKENNNIEENK